jgi:hypothetical protein
MKIKFTVFLLLLMSLGGCGLLGNSPSSVVGKYLKLSEKEENIEAMEKLFSERAKSELGAEKILVDILSAINIGTRVASEGESMPYLKPEETINGDFATVAFYIHPSWAANNDKNNQVKALLIKENGDWKIYGFGQSGEPKPNAVVNSFDAAALSNAYLNHPDLMNARLTGKTIVVEGGVNIVGLYDEDDSGSLSLKTSDSDSNRGYILCKLKTGGKALYEKAEEVEKKKIKIKGTVVSKKSQDGDSSGAVFVLDNCTVQ